MALSVAYQIVEERMGFQMIYRKADLTFLAESSVVGIGFQRIKVLCWTLSGGTEENCEKPARIAGWYMNLTLLFFVWFSYIHDSSLKCVLI
jgi:hypothetical protein